MVIRQSVLMYLLLLMVLFVVSCATPVKLQKPIKDDYGCTPPPPDVFTSAGIDIQFTQSTFGKIITGDIDIKTNPQVIAMASKAIMDDRIRSYLRCLAIKRDGYTPKQAAYFDSLSAFMQTNPNAEQFLMWRRENPFPSIETILLEELIEKKLKEIKKPPILDLDIVSVKDNIFLKWEKDNYSEPIEFEMRICNAKEGDTAKYVLSIIGFPLDLQIDYNHSEYLQKSIDEKSGAQCIQYANYKEVILPHVSMRIAEITIRFPKGIKYTNIGYYIQAENMDRVTRGKKIIIENNWLKINDITSGNISLKTEKE